MKLTFIFVSAAGGAHHIGLHRVRCFVVAQGAPEASARRIRIRSHSSGRARAICPGPARAFLGSNVATLSRPDHRAMSVDGGDVYFRRNLVAVIGGIANAIRQYDLLVRNVLIRNLAEQM